MIKISKAKLIVDTTEFDLISHQGKKVTVFQEYDGSYTIESKPFHYLAVCELEVPRASISAQETGQLDDTGTPITKEVVASFRLSKVAIREFKEMA